MGISIIALFPIQNNQQSDKKVNNSAATRKPLKIKSTIPYWDQNSAFSSFKENVNSFDYVNLFWYYIKSDGEIAMYEYALEDKSIIEFAHQNNIKVFAVITNLPEEEGTSWDSERVENVINDYSSRKKHIDDISEKLKSLDFDGVNIDYEEVNRSQKNKFTLFIGELSDALHKKGKTVSVSLHYKAEESNEENGAFQDWKALSQSADQLTIMAYGKHWDEGNAGPVAPLDWVEKIIAYTQKLNLPQEKLFLGIPLYGYDWNKNDDEKAKGLTFYDVKNLLDNFGAEEKWDSQARSPYFYYENEGTHEVWFENAKSIEEKISLASKAKFGGVSFWRLGEEDPMIWDVLKKWIN